MVEDDPTLLTRLTPRDYEARAERAIVVRVSAWDANCPQHIPRLFSEAELAAMLAEKDVRIAELEAWLRHPSPDLAATNPGGKFATATVTRDWVWGPSLERAR